MSQVLDEKINKLSKEKQELWALRHTAEHLLHTAMQNLYPNLKKAMGPATDEGFYFDFDLEEKINENDFPKIEKEMNRLIKLDLSMTQEFISEKEAQEVFKGNLYKLEWVEEIAKRGEKFSIYKMGGIDLDLCSGPHIASTGKVNAFKLLSVAGAYWHGDEKNKMLQRIYGTAFQTQKELSNHLEMIDEAKKRDHRVLGKSMDLFSTNIMTGQGLILWHPKLSTMRNIVEQYWKDEHYKAGYQLVFTPHIASMDMFVKSRHYNKYINSMFPAMLHQYIEGDSKSDYLSDEQLKPMNCPNHIQIFKNTPKSYRELPLRMGELGTVYRYERAGSLHGMTRVRGFTQDDSHIFCTPEQVIDEVVGVIKLTRKLYQTFGFSDYKVYIATRPKKYLGSLDMWDFAEKSLIEACKKEKLEYQIDEGEGVFYGPKIDSKIKDSLGREWQLGTIQFDFNQPTKAESTKEDLEEFWSMKTFKDKFKTKENLWKYLEKLGRGFDVKYVDNTGYEKQIVMIHRTILGSMERFFGVLIEHFGGAFPTWLSPVQIKVLPISEKHLDYANQIVKELRVNGLRVELDERNETLGNKIRNAQNEKVPYMLIVGDKEIEEKQISVRNRAGENSSIKLDKFIEKIDKEIKEKK